MPETGRSLAPAQAAQKQRLAERQFEPAQEPQEKPNRDAVSGLICSSGCLLGADLGGRNWVVGWACCPFCGPPMFRLRLTEAINAT
jgi:hypothetical protein